MIRKIPSTIFEGQRFTLKQNFYTVALQEAEMQGFEIQNLNSSFSSSRGERVETVTFSVCALKCAKYNNYDHSRS